MMTIIDAVLGPIYILLVLGVAFVIRSRLSDELSSPFLIPALLIKVLGAVLLALIYQYYYGNGDTFYFYKASQGFWRALGENPLLLPRLLWLEAGEYQYDLISYTSTSYFKHSAEWNTSKVAFFASLPGFNTYLVAGINFGVFCFAGQWSLYRAVLKLYPERPMLLCAAIFFTPSSVFWASGLLKDTLVLGGVCFIAASMINIVVLRRHMLWSLFLLLANSYLVYLVKDYPLLILVPCLGLWLYVRFIGLIRSFILRLMIAPAILGIFVAAGYLVIGSMISQSNYLSSEDKIMRTVTGFHVDHGRIAGGSTYSLGAVDYSYIGILSKLPIGLQFTLYRPFPFEARNAMVLVTALESTAYLLISILILFRNTPIQLFRAITGNAEVALCITYTMMLGALVGFVSINYGALARFKTPLLPFFCTALLLLYFRMYKEELPDDDDEPLLTED